MKSYNNKKWFIDYNMIKNIEIASETLKNALEQYRSILDEQYCVRISETAIRRKNPMFIDAPDGTQKQCGYIITGKTGFESRSDNIPYTEQYIELWVNINTIESAF